MEAFVKKIPFNNDDPYTIYCAGDLHIGSRHFRKSEFKSLIDEIDSNPKARLLLVGDLFDAIVPTADEKRFDHSELDPQFYNCLGELPQRVTDYFCDLITPIKDRVDLILTGNHEDKIRVRLFHDYVSVMCNKLSINYGGFMSFIEYRFRWEKEGFSGGNGSKLTFFAVHGGPKSPSRYEYGKIAIADIILHGHTHELYDNQLSPFKVVNDSKITQEHYHSICTGHFSGYPKYAEKASLQPLACGYYKVIYKPNSKKLTVQKVII